MIMQVLCDINSCTKITGILVGTDSECEEILIKC